MSWTEAVIKTLETEFNKKINLISTSAVSGGDINEAYKLETSHGDFFVKKNSAARYPEMFPKEAEGLKLLANANEIAVPEVIAFGEENDTAFLILNFIEPSSKKYDFWEAFGRQLANLHRHSSPKFGLDHHNYIGSLKQSNRKHSKWTDFFREERLEPQLKLARDHGRIDPVIVKSFDRFYLKLNEIFPVEPPALIHGDLWGGNFMVGENGHALIIDPAVYYGNREMDLGMSKLFGGFHPQFYSSYETHYPLEKGWMQRLDYCNLYPLMVHVNLFGGGYTESVRSILKKF